MLFSAHPGMARDISVADVAQLTRAVAAAQPGDKIVLAPGRYVTTLRFTRNNSGTETAPVTVTARDGPGTAVIDSTGTGADTAVRFSSAAHITLAGLDITGGGHHGVFFAAGAHHITLTGNRIFDNFSKVPLNSHAELKGSGPADNRPHHISIADNEIFHRSHPGGGNFQGIDCNFCDDFHIAGNYFHDIRQPTTERSSHYDRGSCIQMKSGSARVVIERNRIARCHIGIVYGGEGLSSPAHIGGVVRNNIIYDAQEIGIAVVNVTDGKILHNTLSGNGEAIRVARDSRNPDSVNRVLIANNILDHPLRILSGRDAVESGANPVVPEKEAAAIFFNAADFDFRLKPEAAQMIDQAVITGPNISTDFAGTRRPQGSAPDIGAFEY